LKTTERRPEVTALQRNVPLLDVLAFDEMMAILTIARTRNFPERGVIARQGAQDGLHVIISGTARVSMAQRAGPPTTIADVGPGSVLGAVSVLDGSPYHASAEAITAVSCLHIDHEGFTKLRAAGHPAAFKIMRALARPVCDRLRALNARVDALFDDPDSGMAELERAVLQQSRERLG
jgi:CRP-like cAMP-binding protein